MKQTFTTYNMVLTALMTALLCVLAPVAIPLPGLVPISLATFVIYLAASITDWKVTVISTVLYLLIGMAGVPVFSSYQAGAGILLGPTGGYLIGYIPMALICGLVFSMTDNPFLKAAGAIAGTIVLYIIGTFWLMHATGMALPAAVTAGMLPFIPGDLIKIVIAVMAGPVIKKRIQIFQK